MPEVPEPSEIGLTEFVARLIADTFEAVATSQLEQEEKHGQVVTAASMGLEPFAQQYISDEEVEAELAERFPIEGPQPHAIFEKAPYRPATQRQPETPAIREQLGVELEESDLFKKGQKLSLKPSACEKIEQATRRIIAEPRLEALRQVVARGFQRIVIDAGRVNAKVTFSVEEEQGSHQGVARSSIKRLGALGSHSVQPNLRLLVRQADERSPQTGKMQVNVFGEVEVTFKTTT